MGPFLALAELVPLRQRFTVVGGCMSLTSPIFAISPAIGMRIIPPLVCLTHNKTYSPSGLRKEWREMALDLLHKRHIFLHRIHRIARVVSSTIIQAATLRAQRKTP